MKLQVTRHCDLKFGETPHIYTDFQVIVFKTLEALYKVVYNEISKGAMQSYKQSAAKIDDRLLI